MSFQTLFEQLLIKLFPRSTSFISKQEGTKTIIEGSGAVKVKEEQKSANFKYIRTVLTEGTEQGIEVGTFNFIVCCRVNLISSLC